MSEVQHSEKSFLNEKCTCGSGKKVKNCCLKKKLTKTQELSSDPMIRCLASFKAEFPHKSVIDLTEHVNSELEYKLAHIFNTPCSGIVLIERTEKNNSEIFLPRVNSGNIDMMILCRGVYKAFNYDQFDEIFTGLCELIEKC